VLNCRRIPYLKTILMPLIAVNNQVDYLFKLINDRGRTEYAGEEISILEHMSQTAMLAEAETDDEELILAAFLHDIGHICQPVKQGNTMNGQGLVNHEATGADFLKQQGFSKMVVELIKNHVLAKRYLTYKYPDYYLSLTDAGRDCLDFQGGPMILEEAFQFEAHPLFEQIIRLRKWDEAAKKAGLATPPLAHYRQRVMFHLVKESNMAVQ
jgi:2-amino-1-hydroxyethylphosphonate dioxygenase (glycine-forming)